MTPRRVLVEELKSGMMLYDWTERARDKQGNILGALQQGPMGVWSGMVLANNVADPRSIDGFGYPAVHRIDVFFWNAVGGLHFETFHWTSGTNTRILD